MTPSRTADRALRAAAAVVASLSSLLVFAAPSVAAGGMDVSPSRIDAQVRLGGRIPPITIRNTSSLPVVVTAQALPATQDLSGLPAYDMSAQSRRAGNALLHVGPRSFTLRPGGSRRVSATVLGCPAVGLGSYAVIVFSGQQVVPSAAGKHTEITSMLRLASTLLLSYPPTPCISGSLSDLRGEQLATRTLGFFARVRNTGTLHAKPRVTLTILRGGRRVFRGSFPQGNVIPRASRDYELLLPDRVLLPRGRYVAVADARMGTSHSRVHWPFSLTGVNRLPSPRLVLAKVSAAAASSGSTPRLAAVVRNLGTAPGLASVRLSLSRPGGEAMETRVLQLGSIAAGRTATARTTLAKLPRGDYQARAELISRGEVVAHSELTFEVRSATPLWTRILDWLALHVVLVGAAAAGLLVLVVLLLVTLLVRARRRRRRDHESERHAAELEPELAEIKAALAELREQTRIRELTLADERVAVGGSVQPAGEPSVLEGLMIARRAAAAGLARRRAASKPRG
jgi:hypothetical protein